MKFTWLQDLDILTAPGGAQFTDRTHFIEGIRRGHDLGLFTPQANPTLEGDCDAFIISNVSLFPLELFKRILADRKAMIWFNHDYWPICKYRLFYPMRDECKSCYLKERWLPILSKAKLMIWLSPLHRESWLWLYPELEDVPYHLSPSPVSPDQFYNMGLKRNGAVAVESLHPFKGRVHVIRWAEEHPEVDIDVIGGDPEPGEPLPPNVKVHGGLAYSVMNEFYNQHKVFLHLPQSPSPFDRAVAEAYLTGCKVVGNENVGALSYPWFKSRGVVADYLRNSPKEFWDRIEEVLT